MAKSPEPVVLELASLPREQMGPFLLLGLDKSANLKMIEQNWADRIKWARRNLIKVPLEDINWARDVVTDPERRIKADAGSINADLTDLSLSNLSQTYAGTGNTGTRKWQPLDSEKDLLDYSPPVELPDRAEVQKTIRLPEIPEEIPAVMTLLNRWCEEPLDPWTVQLSAQETTS